LTDELLRQLKTSTLLIYGKIEIINEYESAIRRAEKNLINLKAEIIPRANHLPGARNPDLTIAAIQKFLSSR
jgi:pimeloyl-ACP methyl ester carboxylesterase